MVVIQNLWRRESFPRYSAGRRIVQQTSAVYDGRHQYVCRLNPINQTIAVYKTFPQVGLVQFGDGASCLRNLAQPRGCHQYFFDNRSRIKC